ncbi:DUF4230 domain-containing protein [Verrucomicrobiaceae bacterium 5K15]|uniref:DUF4230 domain-containing protein n=1 Tax=Oceaniferula flava TaxID=2800421 RepID=A0AAE2SFL1_9BACT|nr:DUF4230 domain-containing protein [Oceaniferula flavus]MBK1856082.1 DUF4230 domain-containing protein [Oceaniferula flavus]MBM1137389.1 DUF4230 domain-containing protein [Oceaniferula flavus]
METVDEATAESTPREATKDRVVVKKSRASWIWALFGGLSLLTVAGFASFYYFVSKPTTAPVHQLAEALSGVFGTEVTVHGSTAVLEKSEIGELALVQRKTQAITKFETTWMGSNKLLIVRGDFLVKAGFDLTEGGQWGILEGKVEGDLPQGKVLSCEPIGDLEIYYAESGTLNRLSPEDHASAFNYLKNQARRDAERSDIGKEAEQVMLRRINDRLSGEIKEGQWKNQLP